MTGSLFRVGTLLAVAAGGAAGGLLRAGLGEVETGWPWPTLLVNLAGAFLLGLVVMYGRRHWSPTLVAGVSVGLLGALTTFSTVTGELWGMLDAGDWSTFYSYTAASLLGGLVAAGTGVRVGRFVR
ncbi:MAG: fluoride efflux transporter FluC [Acidimicrobiia bacterium]